MRSWWRRDLANGSGTREGGGDHMLLERVWIGHDDGGAEARVGGGGRAAAFGGVTGVQAWRVPVHAAGMAEGRWAFASQARRRGGGRMGGRPPTAALRSTAGHGGGQANGTAERRWESTSQMRRSEGGRMGGRPPTPAPGSTENGPRARAGGCSSWIGPSSTGLCVPG